MHRLFFLPANYLPLSHCLCGRCSFGETGSARSSALSTDLLASWVRLTVFRAPIRRSCNSLWVHTLSDMSLMQHVPDRHRVRNALSVVSEHTNAWTLPRLLEVAALVSVPGRPCRSSLRHLSVARAGCAFSDSVSDRIPVAASSCVSVECLLFPAHVLVLVRTRSSKPFLVGSWVPVQPTRFLHNGSVTPQTLGFFFLSWRRSRAKWPCWLQLKHFMFRLSYFVSLSCCSFRYWS
jgi:hypothetical protein